MRKNVFLIGSIFLISLSILSIYQLKRPKVGPIGDGEISTISWILVLCPLITGVLFLGLFIVLLIKKK